MAQGQQQTCGRTCALLSAVLLVMCGIAIPAIAALHRDLIPDAFEDVCESSSSECFGASCEVSALVAGSASCTKADLKNECMLSIKKEHGCTCSTSNHKQCDCDGSNYGLADEGWEIAMIVIAVVGCVLSFLVACLAIAAYARVADVCVCIYSTVSCLFWYAFAALGLFLLVLAVSVTAASSSASDLEFLQSSKKCIARLSEGYEGPMNAQQTCTMTATCSSIQVFKDKARVVGWGLGLPLFLAGILMFVAAYACCCCKEHFVLAKPQPQAAPPKKKDDDLLLLEPTMPPVAFFADPDNFYARPRADVDVVAPGFNAMPYYPEYPGTPYMAPVLDSNMYTYPSHTHHEYDGAPDFGAGYRGAPYTRGYP